MPTRETLCEKLPALPGAIAAAEGEVLIAEQRLRRAERTLQHCQDSLLLAGTIDGKKRGDPGGAAAGGPTRQLEDAPESVCRSA